jgi:hypothetical protein
VRTQDWKQVLTLRGFDPDSPAFTYLPGKETFFDDALMSKESVRAVELELIWKMKIEDLLDKAVRHEFAHALCRERNEAIARRLEEQMKSRMPLACKVE